jgi:hypothetical protein
MVFTTLVLLELGRVVHAYHPSTQEAGAGGS